MALVDTSYRSLLHDDPPTTRAFLRFFGMLCSIPAVERVGCVLEGGAIHHWVQLNNDDEVGQNAIYDALRRFQAVEGVAPGAAELHIIFADEDASAFPPGIEILFARE